MYYYFYHSIIIHVIFTDAKPYSGAYFGEGIGPIHFELPQCVGKEGSLTSCDYETEVACTHSEDAGVVCLAQSM